MKMSGNELNITEMLFIKPLKYLHTKKYMDSRISEFEMAITKARKTILALLKKAIRIMGNKFLSISEIGFL